MGSVYWMLFDFGGGFTSGTGVEVFSRQSLGRRFKNTTTANELARYVLDYNIALRR